MNISPDLSRSPPQPAMNEQERRVYVALALCFCALVVASATAFFAVKGLVAESGLVDHTHQVREKLSQLLSNYQDVQIGQRGYVIVGTDNYLVPFERAKNRADADLHQLSALVQDNPRQMARVSALAALQQQQFDHAELMIRTRRVDGPEAATKLTESGESRRLLEQLRSSIAEMDGEEARLLGERYALQSGAVTRLNLTLLASTIFALLVVAFGGTIINRDFQRRRQLDLVLQQQNQLLESRVAERTKELHENEMRFRMILEGIRDYSIIRLDQLGRIVTWNSGAERIKGYSQEEIIGRNTDIFYLPEDVADGKPARLLAQAAAEGRGMDEGWRVRKNGTRFHASVYIAPILDENGVLLGFAKITQDITERKQAEERSVQLAREQHATNEELGRFNRSMVDRELRMIQLKQEINELCVLAGQPPRYRTEAAREDA